MRAVALGLSLAICVAACGNSRGGDAPLKIAAAASLAGAFADLGAAFEEKTGRGVIISPAASGKLAQQIIEGAPYDVFASADASWVDKAIAADAAFADSRSIYAYGRVVAWTEGAAPSSLADLADPRFTKIAMANPDHAPYGAAAREALQKAGVWEQVESRVVYGSNVRQAYQFADTGNTEVALTALSLVIGGNGYLIIDDEHHHPLEQVVVIPRRTSNRQAAQAFVEFLQSEEGRAILRRYGLLQKGEALEPR